MVLGKNAHITARFLKPTPIQSILVVISVKANSRIIAPSRRLGPQIGSTKWFIVIQHGWFG